MNCKVVLWIDGCLSVFPRTEEDSYTLSLFHNCIHVHKAIYDQLAWGIFDLFWIDHLDFFLLQCTHKDPLLTRTINHWSCNCKTLHTFCSKRKKRPLQLIVYCLSARAKRTEVMEAVSLWGNWGNNCYGHLDWCKHSCIHCWYCFSNPSPIIQE